jgi:transcriptional regulator with XRE-family HTH domain
MVISNGDDVTEPANAAYTTSLGARLRAIRTQQGLSLLGVEKKSGGRWKAVAVGAYERGTRAVTVQRLSELAEFYGVPVSALLPDTNRPDVGVATAPKLVLDLQRLQQLPAPDASPLARYTATLQAQRGDYNGRVLSLRSEDLRSLAAIYDVPPDQLAERLVSWGVLAGGSTSVTPPD